MIMTQNPEKSLTKEEINIQSSIITALIQKANNELYKPQNKKALNYAYSRGLNDETIKKFLIGFIPHKFISTEQYLNNDSFAGKAIKEYIKDPILQEKCLKTLNSSSFNFNLVREIISKDKETYFVENYENRLLFPFIDHTTNKVFGFTGRDIPVLSKKTNSTYEPPKYYNTPENEVFHKREMFFNYNNIAKNLEISKPLVIAEGVMDVIGLDQAGIKAVAGSGIALSDQQVKLIKDLGYKTVVLCYDNDSAGMDAMLRNYETLQKANITVKFVDYGNMPLKDTNEIVNSKDFGVRKVNELIDNSLDEIDFLFKYYTFKKTQSEIHIDETNSKKIMFKDVSKLTDLEKYEILYETYSKFVENHSNKKDLKLAKDLWMKFQNKIQTKYNLNYKEANNLLYDLYNLKTQKPKISIKKGKFKPISTIKPQWGAFENEETIHYVLDLLSAEKSNRRGFYKSLWNNDSNPSLSVKRGQNLWKDFSSGYGGGIYQLLGYCDLSDPEHPKITDNPNQTKYVDGYNWLIKVMHSELKPTTSTDSLNVYILSDQEKDRIKALQSIFSNTKIIACDNDMNDSKEAKTILKKLYPKYFEIEFKQKYPPFFVPVAHCDCSIPIYDVALMNLSDDKKKISVDSNSKYFPFYYSNKNPEKLDIVFELDSDKIFSDKRLDPINSLFIVPKSANEKQMENLLKHNFKIINIKNPTDDFIKNNFATLLKSKKPIFINSKDLISYCLEKKLFKYTDLARNLGEFCPNSIFKTEILNKLNKSSKYSNSYFTTVFDEAKRLSAKSKIIKNKNNFKKM